MGSLASRACHGARRERAQATVEFALVLPLLCVALLLIVDTTLLVRNELLALNSAREGARSAALGADTLAVGSVAKQRGAPSDAAVVVDVPQTDLVRVTVSWSLRNRLVLLDRFASNLAVSHSVTMRREIPGRTT